MSDVEGNQSVYFPITRWAWNFLGVEDLNEMNFASYRFWRAVLLNTISAGIMIMLVMRMLSFDEPVENLWNFTLSITSVATMAKFIIYVRQVKKLIEVEKIFAELDSHLKTDKQRYFRTIMIRNSSYIIKLFIWTFGAITISSDVSFLLTKERSLPFPAWFPLDWTESMTNYLLAIGCQIVASNLQILQNFVDDSFPPLILCLIAGHCELLIMRISLIGHEQTDQRENELQLRIFIQDQEKLYRLLQLTMEIISWPLLVQFVVIAVDVGNAMCILMFHVDTTMDRLYYSCFILGLALEVYPVCYYGTLVEHVFNQLHSAAFCSNWVDQSYAYRRDLTILLERTKRLPKLWAGNIVPIALTTFVANCKAAYSFCTVIADVRGKD